MDGSKNLYPNCDPNIWLRSCAEEIIEPLPGKVTGNIPEWLSGCLLRNGPGSLKVGPDEFDHLFDSSALLHRFAIKNGEVTYQCRFVQSEVFKKNRLANRIVYTEFGTASLPDPCQSIFKRIASIFCREYTDNSMISVYPIADEIFAFGEAPFIHRIHPHSLATEEKLSLRDYVDTYIVHHTSHPHIVADGTMYSLGTRITATGPHTIIVCFPKGKDGTAKDMFENASIVSSLPTRWPLNPSYMHTFGITENYFIVVEQPFSVSVPGFLVSKWKNQPMMSCFRWYRDEYTQINIIHRRNGKLAFKFLAEAFFFLHIIHQYEIEDHIVLDICTYKDPSMLDCMYTEVIKGMQQNPYYSEMFRSRPLRFVLPLKPSCIKKVVNTNLVQLKNSQAQAYYLPNGEILVKPEIICDLGCETPRINYEHYLGKPYRYFYAISADVDAANPGTIIKVDTWTKTAKTWCEENVYPSEPVFVPSPNSKAEDDGVILCSLVWGNEDTNLSGLLVLDAGNLREIARAQFNTPSPVPKCLHGWYLSDNNDSGKE